MTDETGTTPQATPDGTGESQPASQGQAFTQDDLNRIAGKARDEGRDRAMRELTEKYGDFEELLKAKTERDQLQQAQMSELEKLQAKVAALEAEKQAASDRVTKAEADALRLEVGQKKGLPMSVAKLMQGNTRDELEAAADTLVADLKLGSKPTAPKMDATAGAADTPRAPSELTPEMRAAAAKFNMKPEQYLKNLKAMRGES
jgi:hypothetical protein